MSQPRAKAIDASTFSDEDKARFWSQVDRTTTPDGCWEWKGIRIATGYGYFHVAGRAAFFNSHGIRASRLSFALTHGSLPAKSVVLHSCDNPPCCRPDHLSIGTSVQNENDKIARGRRALGEAHHNAKLTAEIVTQIRERHAAGESLTLLAKVFGVTKCVARDACCGITWGNVPNPHAHVKGRHKLTPQVVAQIHDLRVQGLSQEEVAAKTGLAVNTVKDACHHDHEWKRK